MSFRFGVKIGNVKTNCRRKKSVTTFHSLLSVLWFTTKSLARSSHGRNTYSLIVPDNSFSVWISFDIQQGYRRNVRGFQRGLNGRAIPDNHDSEMIKIDILPCSAHNILFGDSRYIFGVLLVEIFRKTLHVNPRNRPVNCADRCELIG